MASKLHAYAHALAAHDARLRERGLDIWIGGEPTFTDRFSADAQWNGAALGEDKRGRAGRVAAAIAAARPGAVLLRPMGRQYPNEDRPRWCYGVYAARDGSPVWSGPADPLCGGEPGDAAGARALRDELCRRRGGTAFDVDVPLPFRFAVGATELDPQAQPELARAAFGANETPPDGPRDRLAERGVSLFAVGVHAGCVRLELPRLANVGDLLALLEDIAAACAAAGTRGLIISGFVPPADETIWWTTVTPDPGVLELNMAPEPGVAAYYEELRAAYVIAAEHGLAPRRIYFNGDVTESGGGGHVTLGGPRPERSPWLREPRLLPRVLAYHNRHPALSYAFAPEGPGSSGQFPRPDEGPREALEELALAVDVLGTRPAPDAEALWRGFAPLLADRFGNTHRCEINIEKLFNPALPLRGKLGVVELRALRMQPDAERAAAVAALFRAVVAYAATEALPLDLVDWGRELHDRFALPAFLRLDLVDVLADLRAAGLGLGELLEAELIDDSHRLIGRVELDDAEVCVKHAVECWPLLGDTSQEQHTSRTVDASVARIEVSVRGDGAAEWQLCVAGYGAPLHAVETTGERVLGVRYRRFAPAIGLHPHVPPLDPVELVLHHRQHAPCRVQLHGWLPGGGAYDGLPESESDAIRRREQRFVVSRGGDVPGDCPDAPERALRGYTLDTRRLPRD